MGLLFCGVNVLLVNTIRESLGRELDREVFVDWTPGISAVLWKLSQYPKKYQGLIIQHHLSHRDTYSAWDAEVLIDTFLYFNDNQALPVVCITGISEEVMMTGELGKYFKSGAIKLLSWPFDSEDLVKALGF